MAKLVVTGGAGFLGLHICRKLTDKYEKILALDIDEFIREEYPANVEFLKADVRDIEALKAAFKGYDVVVNGAAALPLWKPKDIYTV
ncbi:MAG TPA: NAD-dependent epimerase/dehydratase family protein, partial [bacterium]|nr:NAD-dependent epimerase/dehydratase family protein [bacterium]